MAQDKLPNIRFSAEDVTALRLKNVSLVAFLDTIRPRTDGSLTVRLRIIYNRVPKYFTTGVTATSDDYKAIADMNSRPRGEVATKRKAIQDALKKAYDIIMQLDPFTWNEFKKRFDNKGISYANVWESFTGRIAELNSNGQHGTADTYMTAAKSLKLYYSHQKKFKPSKEDLQNDEFWKSNGKVLRFADIDIKWLKDYERWMLSVGKTTSTVSINTRCLRRLFNMGISEGDIDKKHYPFGKGRFRPPEHNNTKRALSLDEIQRLYEFESSDKSLTKYRDLFIFSFLSYGLNLADVCRITYDQVDSKYIELIRHKTASRDRTFTIRILLTDDHRRIIDEYGTGKKYLFDVINDRMSEDKKRKAIKQFTHNMNDNLKRIAKVIDIDPKVSSMFARHSFASIARDAGIPESTISQCMGHSRGFGITGQYFSDVPDRMLKRVSDALLSFKYDDDLTELQTIIFGKLGKKEQQKFLKMNSDERESFTNEFIVKKLQ